MKTDFKLTSPIQNKISNNANKFNFTPPVLQLGSAYSTDMAMGTGQSCLQITNSSIIYSDNGISSYNLQSTVSELNFGLQISGSLGINIDLLIASANAAGLLLGKAQADLYSQSFYFSQTISFPSQIYTPVAYGTGALSSVGLEAYNAGPFVFGLVCGSHFVQQVNYGEGLYVVYQLTFVSWDVKVAFELAAEAEVLLNLYDLQVFLGLYIQSTGTEGIATLLAYQQGGNYTQLIEIFDENLGGLFVTACAFSNLAPCEAAINQTVNYSINSFPFQVNMTANGEYVGNLAPTGYSYMPYTSLGLNATQSQLTPEINAARSDLIQLYENLQDKESFTSHLLDSWTTHYMASDVLTYLNQTHQNISSNIATLTNSETGYISCYTQIQNCTQNAQNLLSSLSNIDEEFIESFATAVNLQYAYCGNINIGNVNGIAVPIGNNNYLKTQSSGYKEALQIVQNGNSLVINEPNIVSGASVKLALVQDESGAYQGSVLFDGNCIIQCSGTIIDNPV